MRTADRLLDDEQLIERVFEAQARRWLNSRTRGRRQTPAEVVLRLLILKHVRNWSYAVLEREVRANLVYRTFARIGAEKVPDAKTLGRLGQVVGPEVIEDLHRRMVQIAVENRVVAGRRMRVDTTVVETNIHYQLGWPALHVSEVAPPGPVHRPPAGKPLPGGGGMQPATR